MALEHITRDGFEQYRGLVRQWHSKKDAYVVAFLGTIMTVPATALVYAKGDNSAAAICVGIAVFGAYITVRAGQSYRKVQKAVQELEQQWGYVEQSSAKPIETSEI